MASVDEREWSREAAFNGRSLFVSVSMDAAVVVVVDIACSQHLITVTVDNTL